MTEKNIISDQKLARFEAAGAVVFGSFAFMVPLHLYELPWGNIFAYAIAVGCGISAYRHGGSLSAWIGGSIAVFLLLVLAAMIYGSVMG